ncbi:hypothetical protein [Pseudomonas fulva]|uniref:hypothetical protein n=1 Tax=Pseudomonas fulva TaxID=47880 RepID=UPI003D00FE43
MKDSIFSTLRAMARNYAAGHHWDHLEGEAVTQAADEIERLRGWVSAYKESRERLHEWLREEQLKNISLRAQLAEAQALLRDVLSDMEEIFPTGKTANKVTAYLSASAKQEVKL